jgi:hypothetical protein
VLSDRDREAPVTLVAALVLGAAMVGSLWIVDYVPTSDGPNHVLAGWLSAHLHDPGRGYDTFVEPGSPVSSLAFHAVFSSLLRVLSWRDALRVTLSIGALLWAAGFASLVWALRRERAIVGLLGFATALSWTFYMGLFSYWMTTGLDLLVLGFVLRRLPPTPRDRGLGGAAGGVRGAGGAPIVDRLALAVALAAAMLGHSFAAMLLGLALGAVALVRPTPRERLREIGWLALVSAPSLTIAYLSARGASRFVDARPAPVEVLRPTWLPWRDRVDVLWQCFTGGPAWRGVVPLVLAVAGVGWLAVRARRGRASRQEIAVAAIAVLMLGAVLVTPIHLGELWQDFSPRFLPFGASLGIALLPFEDLARPALRALAAGAIVLFGLASTGWSWIHHARLSLRIADAMAVLAAPIRRGGARLPIILAPPEGSVSQVDENRLLGDLFAVEQGGMTPYLYATRRSVHPFVWRRPRSELFPPYPAPFYGQFVRETEADPRRAPRYVHLASLARAGAQSGPAPFEDVILWGTPADVSAFEARGYVADEKRGGAAILRFSPCGLSVEVDAGDPGPLAAPLVVEYGWAPLVEGAGTRTFPSGTVLADGKARAGFDEAPCGPVWVRAFRDEDGSGDLGRGEAACAGADDAGRLPARLVRGPGTAPRASGTAGGAPILCRLSPRAP